MTKLMEDPKGVATIDTASDESFYHVGLLPADGDILFPVQGRDDKELKMRKINALELWNDSGLIGEKGLHIFIAKARQFLGLSVSGAHFPSTSEFVEMGGETTSRATFPGGVARFSKDQLKAVVKSCYRHILRYKNGFVKMDDPTQAVEIINLDFGSKPENFSDAEWSSYKANKGAPTQEKFNPKTDKYIADFVYITKLDTELDPSDVEDYGKNPNRFHYQWVGPIKRSFFTDPPKAVSKVYSREA